MQVGMKKSVVVAQKWGLREHSQEFAVRNGSRQLSDCFPASSIGTESTCNAGDLGSIPGSGDPLEKEMKTHSSLLAGKSHGQRSLAELQESDTV